MYYQPWPIVNFCYSALETLDFEVNPCHTTYMKNETAMNLYILKGVLADFTGGMAVVAAPTLERCWELFAEKFVYFANSLDRHKLCCEDIKVIENVNHVEGVVSYVYGGR